MSQEKQQPFTQREFEEHLANSPRSVWNDYRRRIGIDETYKAYVEATVLKSQGY
jgi:hypothetical protein